MRAEHRFEEHTGEVRLVVSAPTAAELYAEAARGLAELMLGALAQPAPTTQSQRVEVNATDRAALLVEWLNELVFRAEISKRVFTQVTVDQASPTHLVARVSGVEPQAVKTAVKAATLHAVTVEERAGGWCASVVLDV